MYDIIIIGAGVSGSAIARELSRFECSLCVLEKCEDVCCGTSKANSAIVHAGFDARPGSMMAKLNVAGNAMMDSLAKDLDIPFTRNGSLVVSSSPEGVRTLQHLKEQGEANGVPGLQILYADTLRNMEEHLSPDTYAALYAPSGGIICPFTLNTALAENAAVNGAEFFLNTTVSSIQTKQEQGNLSFIVHTNHRIFEARCVINAAGVYADQIHNMISGRKLQITPRRGEYFLLDKRAGTHVHHTIFPLPSKAGKGVLVTPTIHGNLLVGPTSHFIADKENTDTTVEGLQEVRQKASRTVSGIPFEEVITSFSGLRASTEAHDFQIGEVIPGFFDCAGIESPGLSAAPAIGAYVSKLAAEYLHLVKKEHFITKRRGILHPFELSEDARRQLILEQPSYGNIICRCEMVTEGEILDAIHRPLGATTIDGCKRRVRTTSGRCQGGFCTPRLLEILSRELPDKSPLAVTKCGNGSELISGIS